MKNTRTLNKSERNQKKPNSNTIEVLYQKMGDRWFAFSLIDNEVFVGSIQQSDLEKTETKTSKQKHKKLAGHS